MQITLDFPQVICIVGSGMVALPLRRKQKSAAAAQETVPEVTVAPVKPMAVIASSAGLMAVGLGVAAYGGWGFSSFESVMNSATSTKSERESIMIAYQGAPVLMGSGLLVLAGGATLLFWPAEESETE